MKFRVFVPLLLCSQLFSLAKSQIKYERRYDPNKVVLHVLENAVHDRYGNDYVVSFHIMDSLIAHSRRGEIADPYGTLAGCVLFSAWRNSRNEDSVITGIFRKSSIAWDDFPGTKAGFASALLATRDINNDGEVDILAPESDPRRDTKMSSIYYLWILSWDGTRGKLINDIDPTTHQSTLVSTDATYELVDINQDGIPEIKGTIDSVWQEDFPNLNPTTLPLITYSWDGSKYGFFASPHRVGTKSKTK